MSQKSPATLALLQVGPALKLRLFASLYFSPGRRVSIWFFVVNFNFIFSIGQQFRLDKQR
jgi:hypothetical protein